MTRPALRRYSPCQVYCWPMSATASQTVDFPSLARRLGLTRRQSEDVLESGVLSPVEPARGRRGTKISPEDAELLEQAMRIVAKAGIAVGVVLILRLLASGAVSPPPP